MIQRQKLPTVAFILKKGKRYESPFFTVWRFRRDTGALRSFVVCSRKVDKRAVRRNTIKRRVREILRKDFSKSYSANDIVVRIKPGITDISSKKLKSAILYVLPLS